MSDDKSVVEALTFGLRDALDRQGCELTSHIIRPAIRSALAALADSGYVINQQRGECICLKCGQRQDPPKADRITF